MPSALQTIVNRARQKTEGTSRTYGQLIEILTGEGSRGSSNRREESGGSHIPTDTSVHIVRNDDNGGDIILTDADRANIALAAVSSPNPTVAVNTGIVAGENVLANNASANVSEVIPTVADEVVVVAGSSYKAPEEIQEILTEAQKIDMMIVLKTKDSEALEFNNIKEVQMEAKFTYNFFSASEADIESQEDPAQDPYLKADLFSVPRYVKLSWEPVMITEPLSQEETTITPEIEELKREVFEEERTESTHIPPLIQEGIPMEVIDMHRLDIAIQSTSNKDVFSNTLAAVLDLRRSPNFIDSLPIRELILNNRNPGRGGRGIR